MTTIAYHHESKTIACDGRSTQGSYISTDTAQKWLEVDGGVWFFTGSVHDRAIFISYHTGIAHGSPEHAIECSAFMVIDGACYEAGVTQDGQPWRVLVDYSHACGSGRDHAVAAMDHCKSAAEAVRYAATRDTCTGGKVSVFDLGKMAFIESRIFC